MPTPPIPQEKYYRNNQALKSWDSVEMITPDEIARRAQELYKCRNDIAYFAEKYFTIVNQDQGEHIIKLFPKQKELLIKLVDEKRLITLSPRQQSKTTTYTIFALWYTMFSEDKKVLIVANRKETACEIMDRIRLAFEMIPNWLKPGIVTWNKMKIEFGNGSAVSSDSTSPTAARGKTASALIIDEMGFIPPEIAKEFFTSVYPVISRGKDTKLFIFSTPNGSGNLFHELWEKAQLNTSTDGWKPYRMYWWDLPGRDDEWKRKMIEEIGPDRFAQEFACEFLSSTTPSLVDQDSIEQFRRKKSTSNISASPIDILINSKKYTLSQYYLPHAGRTYLMSGDVGDGVGLDSSVLHVWDITEWSHVRMVASFASNQISTAEYAVLVDTVGRMYDYPYYVLESNGLGRAVLDLLSSIYQYPNLIRYSSNKRNSNFGIFSHIQIKVRACKFIKDLLATRLMDFEIHDETLINEMPYFIRKSTSYHAVYEALRGKHDDHIMSWIWAVFCLSDEILPSYFHVDEYENNVVGKQIPKYIRSTVNSDPIDVDIDLNELIPEKTYDIARQLELKTDAPYQPSHINTVKTSDIMNPAVKEISMDSNYRRDSVTIEQDSDEKNEEVDDSENILLQNSNINKNRQMIEDVGGYHEPFKINHGFSGGFFVDAEQLDFSAGQDEELFK
jgi:hypothetical protein